MNIPVSTITELDGIPLCLDYYKWPDQDKETLLVGDDLGICHMYEFRPGWHACNWKVKINDKECCHKHEIENRMEREVEDFRKSSKKGGGAIKPWEREALSKPISRQWLDNIKPNERQIHKGWITKIKYIEDLQYIISSSLDGFIHVRRYLDQLFSVP